MRGRDIKRYAHNWAGLYLIATFPAKHYDIEAYPAVRDYLLTFGKERLEQTGRNYHIDGKVIRARKATHNKWFEMQDSISYSDDFFEQKIVWQEMMSDSLEDFPAFTFDSGSKDDLKMVLNTAYILCSNRLDVRYILGLLNSKVGAFIIKKNVVKLGNDAYRILDQYVENFPVPKNSLLEPQIIELVKKRLSDDTSNKILEEELNRLALKAYELEEYADYIISS